VAPGLTPDHLRANGTGWATRGSAVRFRATNKGLLIVLNDFQGEHPERIDNPLTNVWIAKVLNAALQWGQARGPRHTHERKLLTTNQLLLALQGREETPGLLLAMGEDIE
jgi:hypothetical protein